MTRDSSQDGASRHTRPALRLALIRVLLALAYLAAELSFARPGFGRITLLVAGVFLAYSCLLLSYARRLTRAFNLPILFVDLIFLLSLVFVRTANMSAAVAAIFYVFLVLESWSVQGAREVVLLATAVALAAYAERLGTGKVPPLEVTVHSVLFLGVVGGLLAFLFSDQRLLPERRILSITHRSAGASEQETVAAIQQGLRELANWLRCSHALLAFWDLRNEHYCLCRFPPAEEPSPGPHLEDSREWSVFLGEKLTFAANDIPAPEEDTETPALAAGYDLHPHLIRKFGIYNALSCALEHEGKALGRLLVANRVSPVRASLLKRLRRVSPPFTQLTRHLLMIRQIEHAAYERERYRVAQDFHDGPLQSVISFQMRTHLIRKLMDRDPTAAAQELDQLQDLARKQVTELRTFVNSMRPVEADTASLTAAARRLVDDFQKESGVPVTFMAGNEPVRAPGKIGVDVLQIIREALHNIHKHAQATHVLFSLEKNDNHLMIGVNDNGKGFRFGGKYTLEELEVLRLGPNSIKQRMRSLGGDLLLESQPGHGTNLRLKIPLY